MNEVVEEERREIKQGRRLKKHFGPLDLDLVAITKKKIERERECQAGSKRNTYTLTGGQTRQLLMNSHASIIRPASRLLRTLIGESMAHAYTASMHVLHANGRIKI
jgi:hypothetical protein